MVGRRGENHSTQTEKAEQETKIKKVFEGVRETQVFV